MCPTELSTLATAMDQLGPDAARVQPLFITVDPERDTPEKLADYVGLFHPALAGLTGTPEQIADTIGPTLQRYLTGDLPAVD